MENTFCVTHTPGPAMIGLPSCSKLKIVCLKSQAKFRKYGKHYKTFTERERIQHNLKNLKPINSHDDLIEAYIDQFKGTEKFPMLCVDIVEGVG